MASAAEAPGAAPTTPSPAFLDDIKEGNTKPLSKVVPPVSKAEARGAVHAGIAKHSKANLRPVPSKPTRQEMHNELRKSVAKRNSGAGSTDVRPLDLPGADGDTPPATCGLSSPATDEAATLIQLAIFEKKRDQEKKARRRRSSSLWILRLPVWVFLLCAAFAVAY